MPPKQNDWHFDAVQSEALKYTNRSEFRDNSCAAYRQAQRKGWLPVVCQHMPTKRPLYRTWTRETAFAEAAKYQRPGAFRQACGGAVVWLEKHGLLEEATAHMARRSLTKEEVIEIAGRYATVSEWKSGHLQSYSRASKKKWLKEVKQTVNMGGKRFDWTKEEILELARGYTMRSTFIAENMAAFGFACRRGWHEDIFKIIPSASWTWDRESARAEALKYQTKSEFSYNSSAYKWAIKTDKAFFEEICAHMRPGRGSFNTRKPGTLYFLEIDTGYGGPLYKIGITGRQLNFRVCAMGIPSGHVVRVLKTIRFDRGADAFEAEKRLKSNLARYRYSGPPILKNGNTELFVGLTPALLAA